MNDVNIPVQSLKTLLISTISAIFLALIILVTAVWPAEYGIDPTGLGKVMGLTALAPPQQKATVEVVKSEVEKPKTVAEATNSPAEEVKTSIPVLDQETDDVLVVIPSVQETKTLILDSEPDKTVEVLTSAPQPKTIIPASKSSSNQEKTTNEAAKKDLIKSTETASKQFSDWMDTVVITVPPGSGLEYKFQMNKNAKLGYAWATNGAKLYFDFHGEPAGDTTGYFKSYKEKTDTKSNGELVAPFTGVHGWYWENNTKAAVRVTLKTKGKYKVKGIM